MSRINIYLDEKTQSQLNNLATEKGMKTSQYISQLINDAAEQKKAEQNILDSKLNTIIRTQSECSKNVTALMESLNTYFKMFAGDETNSSVFYSVDEKPHPWIRKALEIAESKIRTARYSKLIK